MELIKGGVKQLREGYKWKRKNEVGRCSLQALGAMF